MGFSSTLPKRKIRLVQLADILVNDMHIKRNDFILVHASMTTISLTDASNDDLIFLLKMLVGVDGAILMPVHSNDSQKNKPDLISDPLSELFSKMPDTVRLINHSVTYAMWGKLTKDASAGNVKIGEEPGLMKLLENTDEMNIKTIGIGVPATDYPNLKNPLVIEKQGIVFFLG